MKRPFMTVRATGERVYLDERRPHRSAPPPSWRPEDTRLAPSITIECELCGRPELQVEWVREPPPYICIGCMSRSRFGVMLNGASWADQVFLGRAHAVLRSLQQEAHGHVAL